MTIKSRIANLERLKAKRPATALAGWDSFIWYGPQDDVALSEAEAAAEAANHGLIIWRIVDPPPAHSQKTNLKLGSSSKSSGGAVTDNGGIA